MSVGRINDPQPSRFDDVADACEAAQAPAGADAAEATSATEPAAASPERLLTKKIAGERALLHHLNRRVGPKYEAKVAPGPDRDHYLVRLHQVGSAPPFRPAAQPEAVYLVDRRDGAMSLVEGSSPAHSAPLPNALALGELPRPGQVLADTVRTLRPGETLRFLTRENQAYGLGGVRVAPDGVVELKRRLAEAAPPLRIGAPSLYEYSIAALPGAPPGAKATVTTSGHYQTRSDSDWAFRFTIEVG